MIIFIDVFLKKNREGVLRRHFSHVFSQKQEEKCEVYNVAIEQSTTTLHSDRKNKYRNSLFNDLK
jgi:hypothetical protein